MSRLSRQCVILNTSQPYRPPRSVTGIALLYFYFIDSFLGYPPPPTHKHESRQVAHIYCVTRREGCRTQNTNTVKAWTIKRNLRDRWRKFISRDVCNATSTCESFLVSEVWMTSCQTMHGRLIFKITGFRTHWWKGTNISEGPSDWKAFYPENDGNRSFRKVVILLLDYTVSYSRG
jgi:hypothetical protein